MDMSLQQTFLERWKQYFNSAELPLVFYYTDQPETKTIVKPAKGHSCFIAQLHQVFSGKTLSFDSQAIGCPGGKRYSGFAQELRPGFEYFLSCGIPGKLEGERYKKTPELVKKIVKQWPSMEAPGKYIVFKRWDRLKESDNPAVAVFFSPPDVLSGLFTLANFDRPDSDGVICPMSSGCSSIIVTPYLEISNQRPRAILGMFDVSARPCVTPEILSFALPIQRLAEMIFDVPESFLITHSWSLVQKRI